jgi:hypothetical protein
VELMSFWMTWLITQMLFSYCLSEARASSMSVPERSMMKAPYDPRIVSRSFGAQSPGSPSAR